MAGKKRTLPCGHRAGRLPYKPYECRTCYLRRNRANKPMVLCPSCGRWKRLFHKRKGVCYGCYHRPTAKWRVDQTPQYRYCVICLTLYRNTSGRSKQNVLTCSRGRGSCLSILVRLQAGKFYPRPCVRCGRVTMVYNKLMCKPCYTYTRHLLNQDGIYGYCARHVKTIKHLPNAKNTS